MKILIFALLWIAPSVSAQEKYGWKYLITVNGGEYYYNPKTIVKSGSKVKVWQKNVSNKESFFEGLRRHNVATEKYADFAYSLIHIELDCAEKKYRILADAEYDSKDKVIHSQEYKDEAWDDLLTESIVGKLFVVVCPAKQGKLKTKRF